MSDGLNESEAKKWLTKAEYSDWREKELDDKVEAWHKGAGEGQELYEFLEMNPEDFDEWVRTGNLPEVNRKKAWENLTDADVYAAFAKIGEPCPNCKGLNEPMDAAKKLAERREQEAYAETLKNIDKLLGNSLNTHYVERLSEATTPKKSILLDKDFNIKSIDYVDEAVVHVDDASNETLTEINYSPETGFSPCDLWEPEKIISLLDDLNVLNEDGEDTFKVQYTEDEDDGNFYMFTIKCHDVKNSLSLMLTKTMYKN